MRLRLTLTGGARSTLALDTFTVSAATPVPTDAYLKWSRNWRHVSGTPTTLGPINRPDVSPSSAILKLSELLAGTVDRARKHSTYTA